MLSREILEKSKAEFDQNGFVKIPKVYSKEEIDFLRVSIFNCLLSINGERKYREGGRIQFTRVKNHNFPALLFWPCLINHFIDEIRTGSKMRMITKYFLETDNIKQLNNQVYFRLPGDQDSFAWHQDIIFRKPVSDYKNIENNYIQTAIVVDELTPENGTLQFLPGSQKLGKLELIPLNKEGLRSFTKKIPSQLTELERKVVRANPGDMVIWSLLTVHGSDVNISSNPRMIYMNGFCDANSSKNWPYYLRQGNPEKINTDEIPYK